MSGAVAQATRDVTEGRLHRACDAVARLAVLELALLVACLPGTALTTVLVPDVSNAALFALAAVPVAPAVAAGVHLAARWSAGDDASAVRVFARGWRLGVLDVLRFWVPAVAVLAVLALDLALTADGGPGSALVRPVVWVVGAVVLVVATLATVLAASFRFRTRDLLRLAAWCAVVSPASLLGTLAVLGAAAALLVLAPAWALPLAAAPLVLVLTAATRGATALVADRFTTPEDRP